MKQLLLIALLGIILLGSFANAGLIGGSGGAICKTCPKPIEPATCEYDKYNLPDLECNGYVCRFWYDNRYFFTRQYVLAEPVSTCTMKAFEYKSINMVEQRKALYESKGMKGKEIKIIQKITGWFKR